MTERKKSEIDTVSADSIKANDEIWVYGMWLKVVTVRPVNEHPFQFRQFHFNEFRNCIRVPAGWKVERRIKS
jgi:hypothetical protein